MFDYKMGYLEVLKTIEEYKKRIEEDERWLPRLYSPKVIQQTKIGIDMYKKMIAHYEAELPQLKEEYKQAEIARLTAELERIKNL